VLAPALRRGQHPFGLRRGVPACSNNGTWANQPRCRGFNCKGDPGDWYQAGHEERPAGPLVPHKLLLVSEAQRDAPRRHERAVDLPPCPRV
jgi:hypothetical protein